MLRIIAPIISSYRVAWCGGRVHHLLAAIVRFRQSCLVVDPMPNRRRWSKIAAAGGTFSTSELLARQRKGGSFVLASTGISTLPYLTTSGSSECCATDGSPTVMKPSTCCREGPLIAATSASPPSWGTLTSRTEYGSIITVPGPGHRERSEVGYVVQRDGEMREVRGAQKRMETVACSDSASSNADVARTVGCCSARNSYELSTTAAMLAER